jgi:hypothetical protein
MYADNEEEFKAWKDMLITQGGAWMEKEEIGKDDPQYEGSDSEYSSPKKSSESPSTPEQQKKPTDEEMAPTKTTTATNQTDNLTDLTDLPYYLGEKKDSAKDYLDANYVEADVQSDTVRFIA